MKIGILTLLLALVSLPCLVHAEEAASDLQHDFQTPPDAAKPWTWWHWVSGNVSSEGITADLNAMKKIGLGGAQVFTVDQSDVKGPVVFLSPEWRKLMHQSLVEASQLHLTMSIEGCDGWSESGGHWVTPAQGMQKVVWTEKDTDGGQKIPLDLPQPKTNLKYYEDIALFAFPSVAPYASGRELNFRTGIACPDRKGRLDEFQLKSGDAIDPKTLVDLTGKTEWDAPAGKWTIVRLGHTATGATTHPSTSPGLECDKMSRAAVQSHIDHLFTPVFEDSPKLVGTTLKYILLDSWEAGCENWTPLMRDEFKKRRGYDLAPWLPALTGRIVSTPDATLRFLWDYRRTLADMVADNHYGTFQAAAHAHGMGLSSEAPGIQMPTVADELQCKEHTDIPMGEFWVNQTGDANVDDPKEAASAAHIFGQNIAATESYTSVPQTAAWTNDPYSLKAEGDKEFCLGVNRFIFHRYAHQPWMNRVPGMSMGPWGINFERTNTWWDDGSAWISYLTRCQYLLQQGRFDADICYYYGEDVPVCVRHSELKPQPPVGYDYDVCNADVIRDRMSVENGAITLKSGMRYRVLVLPDTDHMTLPVLQKIALLIYDGATVYGPKPLKSPSLSGFPESDQQLQTLAAEVWGNCDGQTVKEHAYGKGRVVWGEALTDVLATPADFEASQQGMLFIHRIANASDIYFVSNQVAQARVVDCTFRVDGKAPELWFPDSGKAEKPAIYRQKDGRTTLPIHFDPSGSVFVIFRGPATADPIAAATRDGQPLSQATASIVIDKAVYGSPTNPAQSKDVRAAVQALVDQGQTTIIGSNELAGGDPAPQTVKQLDIDYTANGKTLRASAGENKKLDLNPPDAGHDLDVSSFFDLATDAHGLKMLTTAQSGHYVATTASGATSSCDVPAIPGPLEITGPWQLTFPPKRGAPETATFPQLISWPDSPDDGIKYFSGTATYTASATVPAEWIGAGHRVILDLGEVKNLATVKVNGKSLGILWKAPFRVDVTSAVIAGPNQLEIGITNLWPNRLIGDQKLPKDQQITWASVSLYKASSPLLPSGLLGPVRLVPVREVELAK